MFYQHPTPTPKSPLTPRGDFDFFFAAGCFGSGVRCALQSSTRLRYRSLQSLLMLALCRGQGDGVDDFVPHGNIGVAEKENSWKQTSNCFFRPADVTMGKRSTAVTDGEKRIWGLRVPKPLRPPLRTVVASPCVG